MTGVSNNSGTFGTNNSNIDVYDTGNPSLKGSPAFPLDFNTGNVGSATYTGTCPTNSYDDCAATCSAVLPVNLMSFSGLNNCQQIVLSWTTATEVDNAFFTIERSLDGRLFTPIGNVTGAGNSSTHRNYIFTDESVYGSMVYYRLKQIDHDGKMTLLSTIAVHHTCHQEEGSCLTIHPNPMIGQEMNMRLNGMNMKEVTVDIRSVLGNQIYTDKLVSNNDIFVLPIHLVEKPATGTYIVTVISLGKTCRAKLIVQ